MAGRRQVGTVRTVRATAIAPTGVLRTFDAEEVIVSKTDLKGRLTYVNDVFLRVSCYTEQEVLGKPHNVIRHPDMPRAVFSLLWREIQAGREVFAYVLNLAADGVGYWVFAHVTPTFQNGTIIGYHSNRRVPSARAVAAVEPLYAQLRAIEHSYASPVEALAASNAAFEAELEARGVSYDEFVWSLAGGVK